MMELQEEVLCRINKYPKAKYELHIANQFVYSFVTTSHPLEKCVDMLIEMAQTKAAPYRRTIKIIQIINKEKKVVYKGSLDPVIL